MFHRDNDILNRLLFFVTRFPSRIYSKIKRTILKWRGCDFEEWRDPAFTIETGYRYAHSSFFYFHKIIDIVSKRFIPLEQIAFFDAGFGKGLLLIQARKAGIPLVGGVELSQSMTEICRKNMQILHWEGMKLYNNNAADITTELDEFNVFYLFNPFPETILTQFLQNIIESKKRCPRNLILIYYHSVLASVVEKAGFQEVYSMTMTMRFKPEYKSFVHIYKLD